MTKLKFFIKYELMGYETSRDDLSLDIDGEMNGNSISLEEEIRRRVTNGLEIAIFVGFVAAVSICRVMADCRKTFRAWIDQVGNGK